MTICDNQWVMELSRQNVTHKTVYSIIEGANYPIPSHPSLGSLEIASLIVCHKYIM